MLTKRAPALPGRHRDERPLTSPAHTAGLLGVFDRRYLLRLLVRREVNARYSGSLLGIFWSYIQPATRLFIYYVVFGLLLLRGQNIENFAIHLFAGLVIVHFFTESFGAGTRSIVTNKALIQRLAVPREMFPVASMLVSAYHVIPGLILLTICCVATGWLPDPVGLGAGLLAIAIVGVLATALALMFSVANVYMRDWGNVVQILTQFVNFSVPMMYPFSLVEERFQGIISVEWYLVNPLAEVVLLFQRCFWVGTTSEPGKTVTEHMPDHLFTRGFIDLGVALVILVVAQLLFRRFEKKIAEHL